MLLVDSFQLGLIYVMIPNTFGIDDHDRATAANTQAIGHAALDSLWVAQLIEAIFTIQFAEALVQPLARFRLGAVTMNTDKNVPAIGV
jgi:hypothetical protein